MDGSRPLGGDRDPGDQVVPGPVRRLAGDTVPELVWRNELGGLTYALPEGRFVKWNPRSTGIDLDRERRRLLWLAPRHPAPRVLEAGADDDAQWLVTAALPGEHAVGERWRARPGEAVRAIAHGLRALHGTDLDEVPTAWTQESWVGREPAGFPPRPALHDPVLVHGDACAPNTLVDADGRWVGHVDLGDLAVGDRWADLAIAALSLDWNFGEGHQHELYDAYGTEPDHERITWYRALWQQES